MSRSDLRLPRPRWSVQAHVLFALSLIVLPAASRGAVPDSATSARYAGVYRLAPRVLLEIQPSDAGDGTLFFAEPSGRAGRLRSVAATEFVTGPNLRDTLPIERRARFEVGAGDRVVGLWWTADGKAARHATRVRAASEDLDFVSGDARLAGTFTRPCAEGRVPAVVLLHGSGPATRGQFGAFPEMCAALGIACLAYDKRGAGRSTGRYHDFLTIAQLADDAGAAIACLKARSDVDSTRVGIVAWSQGGWVASRLAERLTPAFVVLVSSPTRSVAENGLFEIENDVRAAGFGELEVAESIRLNRLFNRMILSGGRGWDTLSVELQRARRAPWFQNARLPDSLPSSPAPANLRWVERLRGYMEYDPMPAWRRTRLPVLAFYGGMDRNLPGRQSADSLRAALAESGNRDAMVHFAPDADHWLWRMPASGRPEERRAKVDGLGQQIADWLVARARSRESPGCRDQADVR